MNDHIEYTDTASVLEWLRPGEYNFVSREMVITHYAGEWVRCYRGRDILVRDHFGVYPTPKEPT